MDPFVLVDEDFRLGDSVPLPADAVSHLRKALRLADGAAIVLSNGRGSQARATLDGSSATVTHEPSLEDPPSPAIRVMHALPKGRKLDEVVRVMTELGVAEFVPVVSERSIVRLDGERASKAADRWTAIAHSAAGQARRAHAMAVATPKSLPAAISEANGALLVAHVGAHEGLGAALPSLGDDVLTVAVGPEGGWSPAEIEAFRAAGARVFSIGESVLRTEHAATAVVSAVLYANGRFG